MTQIPLAARKLLAEAHTEAMRLSGQTVAHPHLLLAICSSPSDGVKTVFNRCGIDPATVVARTRHLFNQRVTNRARAQKLDPDVVSIASNAIRMCERMQFDDYRTAILVALLDSKADGAKDLIRMVGLRDPRLRTEAMRVFEQEARSTGGHPPTPLLDGCGRDLTALATAGALPPVVGRKEEIARVLRILLQKNKPNPLLVGEPGVGKTSVAEGVARFAASAEAPEPFCRWRIVEVYVSSLVAGTELRGEFEGKIRKLLDEARTDPDLIVFFDEIHAMMGAGSTLRTNSDMANILKPALARGELRCIGASTSDEFQAWFARDAALERRFSVVDVAEPSEEEAVEILRAWVPSLQEHHDVDIPEHILRDAVTWSVRFLPDRRLPDKACDLVDEAAALVRMAKASTAPDRELLVTRHDLEEVLAERCSAPRDAVSATINGRITGLASRLISRIHGQDHAVEAVAQVVRRSHLGLGDEGRPLGVFLFAGPTGVGKTEMAKVMTQEVFDDPRSLIRFDMGEVGDGGVARLLGAPPGYIGHGEPSRLVESMRSRSHATVLFDEIEKAPREVLTALLRLMDEGEIEDARGRRASFRNAYIVLTSNLLADTVLRAAGARGLGFRTGSPRGGLPPDREVRLELCRSLPAELVNRIDRVICFLPLGDADLRRIARKHIERAQRQLAAMGLGLFVDPSVYDLVLRAANTQESGARGIERAVDEHLTGPVAQSFCDSSVRAGTRVYATTHDGTVRLEVNASGFQRLTALTPVPSRTSTFVQDRQPALAVASVAGCGGEKP